MNDNYFISVLMPVYNDELYIEDAINSIINQSYINFELIIIDDVSTDKSYIISKEYTIRDKRIKLYRNSYNLGPYKNWDKALSYVSGEYITYITGHDKWDSTLLETYINIIKSDAQCVLAYFPSIIIDKFGKEIKSNSKDNDYNGRKLDNFNAIINGNNSDAINGLLKREAMLKTGIQPICIENDTIFLAELSLYGT